MYLTESFDTRTEGGSASLSKAAVVVFPVPGRPRISTANCRRTTSPPSATSVVAITGGGVTGATD
jgi:hypothetical protein